MDREVLDVFNAALAKAAPAEAAKPMEFAEEAPAKQEKEVRTYTAAYDPDAPTELQEEALKYNWDPSKYKSAEEFLRTYPLTREIADSHKYIKQLSKKVDDLASMMSKEREAGYQQALKDLRNERTAAIRKGDVARVDALDQQIQNTQQASQQAVQPAASQVVKTYVEGADWIRDKTSPMAIRMAKYLNTVDKDLRDKNPDDEDYVKAVDAEMREAFPTWFKQPDKAARAPAVEGDSAPVARGKKASAPTYDGLSAKEKEMADYFSSFSKGKIDGNTYAKRLTDHREAAAAKQAGNPRLEKMITVKGR